MTKLTIHVPILLLLLSGCTVGPQELASVSSTSESVADNAAITQVDYEEAAMPELVQPPGVDKTAEETAQIDSPQPLPSAGGLTLDALEQMAFSNNPAIGQSAARVRALRGKCLQVGLKPNPTVGYVAGEVGNDGAAGQQGVFAGQDFITAGKLQRNRAIVAAEISRAEQELAAVQRRVQTDVRQGYYDAQLAQRRVELAAQLARVTTAQHTYSQTNLAYLDALELLWKSYVEIDGLLLTDS